MHRRRAAAPARRLNDLLLLPGTAGNSTGRRNEVTTTTQKVKRSQRSIVRDHLAAHGYITPLIANNYGVTRLAARVQELKDFEGLEIQTELRKDDFGKRYAYYTLAA
jgi:hypothetical protein